jgi:hypothetical protein
MGPLKVLAFFNSKNWKFSIEAREGSQMGEVIDHVELLVLREAIFSKDKSKIGAVLGLWDKRLTADVAVRKTFGSDENAYGGLSIIFDFEMGKYIEDDLHRVLEDGEDPLIHRDLEKDPSFKLEIKQQKMEVLFLHADEDSQDITGFFCNRKRRFAKKEAQSMDKGNFDLAEESTENFFPRGTDPEEIFESIPGIPKDQRDEIVARANTDDIWAAVFHKDGKKSHLTAFTNSGKGMFCRDSDSMEKSEDGNWDGEFLEIEYPGEIVRINLDGSEEVVETLEPIDNDEE